MVNNSSFADIRGFNYQPSYAATGWRIWTEFQPETVTREVGLCRKYFPRTNTLRLWLSFDAFVHDPKLCAANFSKMLDILNRHRLRAMPTLFNNWHSIPDFGGVTAEMVSYWDHNRHSRVFTDYLETIVGPYARDERILAWDLCNEPFNSGREEVFLPWLQRLRDHCRQLGAVAPITVGVPGSVRALTAVEPLCDVLTPHCYFAKGVWSKDEAAFGASLDEVIGFARQVGKPLFAGETGWGALDDAQRVETLKVELGALTQRGVGYCIHLLHHSLVADGHRPEFGIVSEAGFMGCIEADGSLRQRHEVINDY